jgi:hypothetical protein
MDEGLSRPCCGAGDSVTLSYSHDTLVYIHIKFDVYLYHIPHMRDEMKKILSLFLLNYC